jgi:formylglycine-generating enzyme
VVHHGPHLHRASVVEDGAAPTEHVATADPLVSWRDMRRLGPGVLLVCGLASTATWAACGGDAFTTVTAPGPDGAASSSTVSNDEASTEGAAGSEAGQPEPESGVAKGSPPEAGPVAIEASTPPIGCPEGRGPTMVVVDGFCIDSTEVTSTEYNDFLLAGPAVSGQPSVCSWNSSYLPGNGWVFSATEATLPIANVNWCDAFAFCKWAGKRLCGEVGGGEASFDDFSNPANEHYAACSNAATRIYPYGNTFDSAACNGVDMNTGHVVPVGSLAGCQGGVPGLFDMSGNVEEWQNACNGSTGQSDQCLDGTGAFDYGDPPTGTRCDFADSDARNGEFPDVGFRCCASLP